VIEAVTDLGCCNQASTLFDVVVRVKAILHHLRRFPAGWRLRWLTRSRCYQFATNHRASRAGMGAVLDVPWHERIWRLQKQKINLEKVKASLNTLWPKCGARLRLTNSAASTFSRSKVPSAVSVSSLRSMGNQVNE
jgi:hypothetical protein